MKLWRVALLIILSFVLISSIRVSLNFTASNPTGRRYSSQTIDLALSTGDKGYQGEQIVAHDLGITNNNNDARTCICNNSHSEIVPTGCNSCVLYIDTSANYRIPDFITDDFIVEVKNHREFTFSASDTQITDFATTARQLDIPLWLFARTDTEVDPRYEEIVAATGGEIVYYLAVPGYVDSAGQAAKKRALLSLAVIALIVFYDMRPRRSAKQRPTKPNKPEPEEAFDTLEKFSQKMKDKTRLKIDIEDERNAR